MTDTDVRFALARATDDISAPPDLLDRVRAGGRRRVVRRRAVLGAGLAVAAAGTALPVLLLRGGGEPYRAATRGDLAGDADFLSRVRRAWRDSFGGERPHVWWAGSTPAGPVALVAQWYPEGRPRASSTGEPIGENTDQLGFVIRDGDRLLALPLVAVVPAGTTEPFAVLLGRDRDVLVVTGADRAPVSFSGDYDIDGGGRVARRFTPLKAGPDGVVVRRVTPQTRAVRIGLRQDPGTPVALADVVELLRPQPVVPTGDRLERRLPGWQQAWAGVNDAGLDAWDLEGRDGFHDPFGYHSSSARTWRILGALPGGRRLMVQTLVLDGQARAFQVTGPGGDARYRGQVSTVLDSRDGPLPVLHVRLPDRQGVLVAAENAALRYRARTGAWLRVTGDAALLPDAATGIEVTPRRGRAVVVALP